jgi:Holliday junction resolvasome RuvABC endonuclease subunit
MTEEKILALDMSTKTGYSCVTSSDDGIKLIAHGQLEPIKEPEGQYPGNYVDWAYLVFNKVLELIKRYTPDVLVIEETCAGSKSVYSQKILEFCHFLLASFIKESNIKVMYLLTGEWRTLVGSKMTKEESKHNKSVREYKKKNKTKVAYDESGKRIGIKTKKHVNIRRANEIFGEFLDKPLQKKNEDEADALLLAAGYHYKRIEHERRKSLG